MVKILQKVAKAIKGKKSSGKSKKTTKSSKKPIKLSKKSTKPSLKKEADKPKKTIKKITKKDIKDKSKDNKVKKNKEDKQKTDKSNSKTIEKEISPKKEKKSYPVMTIKLLEEVTGELFGEDIIPLIFKLKDSQNISEFVLAKDMKWDIHQTRAILYRLYETGLATFYRKKDKLKGWYVCYWDLDVTKLDYIKDKIHKDKVEKLQKRLNKEESNDFYMCPNLCTRTTFDQAMDLEFRCPECNEIMNPVDNKRTIEFLSERLDDLTKEASA